MGKEADSDSNQESSGEVSKPLILRMRQVEHLLKELRSQAIDSTHHVLHKTEHNCADHSSNNRTPRRPASDEQTHQARQKSSKDELHGGEPHGSLGAHRRQRLPRLRNAHATIDDSGVHPAHLDEAAKVRASHDRAHDADVAPLARALADEAGNCASPADDGDLEVECARGLEHERLEGVQRGVAVRGRPHEREEQVLARLLSCEVTMLDICSSLN